MANIITSKTKDIGRSKKDNNSAVFGYVLMSIAILSFLALIVQQEWGRSGQFISVEIPILFFITMLGFVFIYPDLMKDQSKNLSTMRIVVFMMVNVICMLMLKIGWFSNDFSIMGINGYWVTVIGFVFGGKVAQSYIENHPSSVATAAINNNVADAGTVQETPAVTADVAKMAADQNRAKLQSEFENVSSVSDTVSCDDEGVSSFVVGIYVKNSDITKLPTSLTATLADQSTQNVSTLIITDVGDPQLQAIQDDSIFGSNTADEVGSIGAMVNSSDINGFRGILTSGHVQSDGRSTSIGQVMTGGDRMPVKVNGALAGVWHFQIIDETQDLAIAQLDAGFQPDNFISFKGGGFYTVGNGDVGKTQVNLQSAVRGKRKGYILGHNFPQSMPYKDGAHISFNNIILVGSSSNQDDSHPVSEGGDSGGCVYVTSGIQNKLVGLILGRDQKFTYVLPVQDTLDNWNFNLM